MLVPHAGETMEVLAGFERDDIADGQRLRTLGHDVGRLGMSESEAVADVAAEVERRAPADAEHVPHGRIDVAAGDAGP